MASSFRDMVAQAIYEAPGAFTKTEQARIDADAAIAVMVARIKDARKEHDRKCPPYCCADIFVEELEAEGKP